MTKIHAEASMIIKARPAEVHAVIADYRVGHPAILPKPWFNSGITVEQGGQGAGTVIRFTMKVGGKESAYHQRVSEPEPGRVLVESEIDSDLVTTFTFEPLNEGTQTRLIITTDLSASPGFKGFIEKLTMPLAMKMIYKKELQNTAEYVIHKKPAVTLT